MPREESIQFRALGSNVHLLAPDREALQKARSFLEDFEQALSRFRPDSELSQLNRSSDNENRVSPLLWRAIETALCVAKESGGIVDPTLLPELQAGGYRDSWSDTQGLSYEELQKYAPRSPAARPRSLWQEIELLPDNKIWRPAGTQIDLGGIGKGLAADMVAHMWQDRGTWCVSLGGDMRLGGIGQREIILDSPLGARSIWVSEGAVASSGVWRRAWLQDGIPQNHLRDPLGGHSVWGPYIQATALAPTAVEAERRAKEALLLGSEEPLGEKGGLLLGWQGEWTELG